MRDFACPSCGQTLAFENSLCLNCGSSLGFDLDARAFLVLAGEAQTETGVAVGPCLNLNAAGCNWVVPLTEPTGLCGSCRLTRTRPPDTDTDAMESWAEAETAKRRLLLELSELELPIEGRDQDEDTGLAFDLLSSNQEKVTTGHADGVVTLDLAEGDDVHREQMRVEMDEPYRTLLGHFRHEIGHYYYMVLISGQAQRAEFERLFGDPDSDYQAALDRHYQDGAPAGWENEYVSAYATMHPAEDWAETFAHYLHIRDTLDTAAAFGFAPAGATLATPLVGDVGFDRIIDLWLPLEWALNMINRSMGHPDLYPFVLPPAALEKLRLVHKLVTGSFQSPQG